MPERPYLSAVVTARNDNHGGNLLRRMQIFLDGWAAQCARCRLPAELVIVEWNPPEGPGLADVLRWPEAGPCEIRILRVPPEIHRGYRHAAALPLYQMIAKNAGIRRARGEFVLATNIDLLFSSELMEFLARRELDRARMYRIDRYDAASDVPENAPVEQQLAWCRSHLLRINRRNGTFLPDGRPVPHLSFRRQLVAKLRRVLREGPHVEIAFPPRMRRPVLHTNGCGDFTLVARDRWFDLRGYPEFDMFSFNIDSVFCYSAHYGGARELVLPDPMRIYHIEHASGWTPEGQQSMYDRIAALGIPSVGWAEVMDWGAQMERLGTTLIFNRDDWGLGSVELTDICIRPGE